MAENCLKLDSRRRKQLKSERSILDLIVRDSNFASENLCTCKIKYNLRDTFFHTMLYLNTL
jgi:hypothetical protein